MAHGELNERPGRLLHCKFKRSVSAPKCQFNSMAPGADLALRGSILSSGAISTPIKTVPAPSKTDSAHSGRQFSPLMHIGAHH